ncbi:hypothetical protein [Psychrobacillus sp. L3]|uniref:hypothetical protein n=1 Tax=Psychrobacillus sp. L3 TaxID=3236891 RepID=UPI0036F44B3D
MGKIRQLFELLNNPRAHTAIYLDGPEGNSVELITPIRFDIEEDFEMMRFEECLKR